MEKFLIFIGENFMAVLLLISLIVILVFYERKKGGTKIDASELTRLINKEEPYVFDLRSIYLSSTLLPFIKNQDYN
jgi:uncharacterized membrane protein (Fun14 family)